MNTKRLRPTRNRVLLMKKFTHGVIRLLAVAMLSVGIADAVAAAKDGEGIANVQARGETASETGYVFVVWTQSGEQISYPLAERPVVTQTNESLVVTTTATTVEYPKTGVRKFTLKSGAEDSDGIETIVGDKSGMLMQRGNTVCMSGFRAGSDVRVFTVSGQNVSVGHIGNDGTLMLDLSQLAAGVYIISTESITYKIIKR